MKTIIFVSFRRLSLVDLAAIRDPNHYRFVAVYNHDVMAQEVAPYADCFDAQYEVPNTNSGYYGGLRLNEQALRDVIEAELTLANDDPTQLALVSNDEFVMEQLGELRKEYHIPGPDAETVLRFRDKGAMKQALTGTQVRIPKYETLQLGLVGDEQTHYLNHLVAHYGLPLVIKPVDAAGSLATFVIDNDQKLRQIYQTLANDYPSVTFEVNEFLGGTMYHCDMMRSQGEVVFAVACEYLHTGVQYAQGLPSVSMPLPAQDPLSQRIIAFAKEVLAELGEFDGVTHMELFHTPNDELVFLEVAARPPGDTFCKNYELIYAFNMMQAHVMAAMGTEVPYVDTSKVKTYLASGRVPWYKGRVVGVDLPEMKSDIRFVWNCQLGHVYGRDVVTSRDYAGEVWLSNTDYQQLAADFASLRDHRFMQVEPLGDDEA